MFNRRMSPEEEMRQLFLQLIYEVLESTVALNFKGGVAKTTFISHLAYYVAKQQRNNFFLAVLADFRRLIEGIKDATTLEPAQIIEQAAALALPSQLSRSGMVESGNDPDKNIVVLIDADMQANGGMVLLPDLTKPTLTDVLRDKATIDEALVQARPNLYVLPSDLDLDKGSDYIASDLFKFRHLLFDWLLKGGILLADGSRVLPTHLLFDTAGLTNVTKAVLVCCKDIAIPFKYEYLSFTGVFSLMEKIKKEMDALEYQVFIRAVIPTMVDETRGITKSYYRDLRQDPTLGPWLYPPLHNDVKIVEAQERSQTIFEYMPSRRGAKELTAIAQFYTGERNLDDYLDALDKTEGVNVEAVEL